MLAKASRNAEQFQAVNLGLAGDEGLREARNLAERALALDAALAQAHGGLAGPDPHGGDAAPGT